MKNSSLRGAVGRLRYGSPRLNYCALIAMRLTPACGVSDFGSAIVRAPFLKDASAFVFLHVVPRDLAVEGT
jgi:hypothetical protein